MCLTLNPLTEANGNRLEKKMSVNHPGIPKINTIFLFHALFRNSLHNLQLMGIDFKLWVLSGIFMTCFY